MVIWFNHPFRQTDRLTDRHVITNFILWLFYRFGEFVFLFLLRKKRFLLVTYSRYYFLSFGYSYEGGGDFFTKKKKTSN